MWRKKYVCTLHVHNNISAEYNIYFSICQKVLEITFSNKTDEMSPTMFSLTNLEMGRSTVDTYYAISTFQHCNLVTCQKLRKALEVVQRGYNEDVIKR